MASKQKKSESAGTRFFPGVDLSLWFNLMLMALFALALIGGGVAVAVR